MTDTCLFAHYDPNDRLADHVLYYLAALRRAGFAVTVISTARLDATQRGKLATIGAGLLLRENAGLDFGSWAEGLARLRDASGQLRIDGRLLLTNDSVFGPIGDLGEALARLARLPGDVHAMVESREIEPHLQSWFLLFSPAAYRHTAFERAYGQNFAAMSKPEIIGRGEISLSADLRAAGLRLAALASDPPLGGARRLMHENPAQFLWRALIERDGVPFVKVELLRDNPKNLGGLAAFADVARARAPDLLALIDAYLADQRPERAATPTPGALSRQAFVLRDDAFARRRARLAGRANWFFWRLLQSTHRLARPAFGSDGSP